MPDTGAPWNIPYVTSTDLVSDWPADSLALANAIDAGLDAAGNAGIGSNVVQTIKTDTFSTSSTSFTNVTGLAATITPTSATAKIYIVVSMNVGTTGNAGPFMRLTGGNSGTYVGNAAGSRTRTATSSQLLAAGRDTQQENLTIVYLDSPATTSATTYQVQMLVSAGTVYVNRSHNWADSASVPATASSITVIEVGA